MKMYTGRREGHTAMVYVDGVAFDPGPSQAIYNHSPTGFEWGYGGSGPHQLGLAILFDVFGDQRQALTHYRDFVKDFISTYPLEGFTLMETQVHAWMAKRFTTEEGL